MASASSNLGGGPAPPHSKTGGTTRDNTSMEKLWSRLSLFPQSCRSIGQHKVTSIERSIESYQESSSGSLQHWHAPDRLPCPAAADPEHSSAFQDLSFPCHVRSAKSQPLGSSRMKIDVVFFAPAASSSVSIQIRAGKSERF